MNARPVVLIAGHPPRIAAFQEALAAEGMAPALVFGWEALPEAPDRIAALMPPGAILRLDSPGRAFPTLAKLWREGATDDPNPHLPAARLDDPAVEQAYLAGHLLAPAQAMRGLARLAARIAAALGLRPDVTAIQDPAAIALLGDKPACRQVLAAAGVPVPPTLTPLTGAQSVLESAATRPRRLFIKLDHGSNGAGMVALASSGDGRLSAHTTAVAVEGPLGPGLANTRLIQTHRDASTLAPILDRLARERAHVEGWVPKASHGGLVWDLRVLTIAGAPAHVVARASRTPFTNLHLRNQRFDDALVRHLVPAHAWESVGDTVRRVAGLFPTCLHLGVDVAVSPDRRRHWVLEVNVFGDHLKGASWQGLDPQRAILQALPRLQAAS